MTSPDYPSVLADLRAKRNELDELITGLERVAGAAATEDRGEGGGPVPSDAFFNMTTAKAIPACLSMSQRPQTTKQVADALESGGFIHESKSLYNMIYTALGREARKGSVVRLPDKTWGLAERYPRNARQQAGHTPASADDDMPSSDDAADDQEPSRSVAQVPALEPESVNGVAASEEAVQPSPSSVGE